MRAGCVLVVLLQKSHQASPSRPFAHSLQMKAISVRVLFLQKSHQLSRVLPTAQALQIWAKATRGFRRPQK